jgi:hypothetical protein
MADAGLPITPVMNGGPAAPIEGAQPTGPGHDTAGFGTSFEQAYHQNIGPIALDREIGADFGDQTHVSHDEAVKQLQGQGLDGAWVPAAGTTAGTIRAEVKRQSLVRYDQIRLDRTNGQSGVANFAAGVADPINLALPGAGAVIGKMGLPLAGRLALGATEATAYNVSASKVQGMLTGHDEDMNSYQMLQQLTLGAGIGALGHATFGERAMVRPGEKVTPDVIAQLERTEAAAKREGISPNDVVSPTGAVGMHQIEPGTARMMGLQGSDEEVAQQLRDPVKNKEIAQKYLDYLDKRYKGDPEAVAIGYNAGPGRADEWLHSNRDDSVLPKETQDYVRRLRGVPMDQRVQAGSLAMQQMAADHDTDVDAVFSTKRNALTINDEHDQMMQEFQAEAERSVIPNVTPDFTLAPVEELRQRAARTDLLAQAQPEGQTAVGQPANENVAAAQEQIAAINPDALEGFKKTLADTAAAPVEGTLTHDELTKAVQTAAQCALGNGVTYATD